MFLNSSRLGAQVARYGAREPGKGHGAMEQGKGSPSKGPALWMRVGKAPLEAEDSWGSRQGWLRERGEESGSRCFLHLKEIYFLQALSTMTFLTVGLRSRMGCASPTKLNAP